MESFISNLHTKVSKDTVILTKNDSDFAAANERWTDIDRETPAVIVQPTSEEEISLLVSNWRYGMTLKKISTLMHPPLIL